MKSVVVVAVGMAVIWFSAVCELGFLVLQAN
jgi:hypothetical protein